MPGSASCSSGNLNNQREFIMLKQPSSRRPSQFPDLEETPLRGNEVVRAALGIWGLAHKPRHPDVTRVCFPEAAEPQYLGVRPLT